MPGLWVRRFGTIQQGKASIPAGVGLQAGSLQHILPGWIAADARFSTLIPNPTGLLPAVRSLVDVLAVELPEALEFAPDEGQGFEVK
ncbi:hypothetical protein [Paraburkholderia humisilvae]|uniref:Uncharacterized protein n=1 Tax=Paraburkholderia humisilvae TaxID=627669 RepID=A0A6J5ETR4_9BURK|nr:hypothetical protein [Paraburkholderia humisilvae]CAB3769334.1 hypothetical protein LMG29542_06092 [Paraburkholderia humisilvae]